MRQVLLVLSGLFVFAIAVLVLYNVMPAPLKDIDLLVIGSIATLVALLVMFIALRATRLKTSDTFFKKRKKKR